MTLWHGCSVRMLTFYYHFKDKYDLVAWMFCTDAYGKDITSITSAAAGMNYSSKAAPGYRYLFPTNFCF